MHPLSYHLLRPAAEDALGAARYSPKKLILIHTAVSLAVGLVLSILTYVLDLGIAQTGGLSGINSRAMLQSLQSLLSMVSVILLPFWEVGYLFTALQFARRRSPDTGSLFAGLRNWGVVLRSMVLKCALLIAVVFIGVQILSTVYLMTPAARPMYDFAQQMAEAGVTDPFAMAENEEYVALVMQAIPVMLIGLAVLILPLMYLLRFVDYVVMDRPELGARYAVRTSIAITWRNFKQLFKLDLHFWWYYLLELLVATVSYGYLALDVAGIDIGIAGDTAVFVFYLLSLAAQLGLYVWRKNTVFTTYALAYDCLCPHPEETES